jgi:hypothetical protein
MGTKLSLQANSNNGLTRINNGKFEVQVASREEAWAQGLNIRKANTEHPRELKKFLVIELGKLIKFIDAKKTIETEEDLMFTIESIIEDFPALKLEEIVVVFQEMKQGKWGKFYERLKTPEILDIFRTFEGQRSELLERINRYENDNRYSQRIGGGDPWQHIRTSINPNG